MYVLDVQRSTPAAPVVDHFSATRLYDVLRAAPVVLGSAKLNLEGATLVAGGATLLLCQRGNVSGVNTVVSVSVAEFEAACRDAATPLPSLGVTRVALPQHDGWDAGLSGCTTLSLATGAGGAAEEFVLFSASYEATRSEIDDGDTLGSIVCLLRASDIAPPPPGRLGVGGAAAPDAVAHPAAAMVRAADGSVFIGKIEGIAPLSTRVTTAADGSHVVAIHALAVTDPDGDPSQYVVIDVTLPVPPPAHAAAAAGGAAGAAAGGHA